MHGSRDSSVWRTLAVAFGDGLAFGVGLTLTNNAARAVTKKPAESTPDMQRITERLQEIEQRIERPRIAGSLPTVTANGATVAKVAEAVMTAMDTRFGEIGEQVEQRLAELEERLRAEMEALEARESARTEGCSAGATRGIEAVRGELTAAIEAQRIRADSDARMLRSQMLEVHKQFAETLARLVDEQIEHTIALRLQAIQEQTREAAREEAALAMANFGKSMEALIDTRLEVLRQERSGSEREMAALRTRLEGNEHNMFEVILALGKSCMQAAEQMTPANGSPANGNGGGTGETHIAVADTCDLPSFARQAAPKRLWRVPFVSCFLMATSGLLALHYLVV